jgi:hypothetical protein
VFLKTAKLVIKQLNQINSFLLLRSSRTFQAGCYRRWYRNPANIRILVSRRRLFRDAPTQLSFN